MKRRGIQNTAMLCSSHWLRHWQHLYVPPYVRRAEPTRKDHVCGTVNDGDCTRCTSTRRLALRRGRVVPGQHGGAAGMRKFGSGLLNGIIDDRVVHRKLPRPGPAKEGRNNTKESTATVHLTCRRPSPLTGLTLDSIANEPTSQVSVAVCV